MNRKRENAINVEGESANLELYTLGNCSSEVKEKSFSFFKKTKKKNVEFVARRLVKISSSEERKMV